ncbi:MAG: hypothetical protein V7603_6719 [Micromonosporaceae bacterium]
MADRGRDQPGERRIDFAQLRREVEAAVMLPDFAQVTRRARWRRARTRLTTVGTVLLVVGILGPAGVVADLRQTTVQGWVSRPDPQRPDAGPSGSPTSSAAAQVTLAAAAGVDLNHVYALVDVCVADSCSLQLSRLANSPGNSGKPIRSDLLRGANNRTGWLDSVRLTALSDTSLLVSGLTDGDRWQYEPVDLGSNDGPPAQSQTPPVTTADRTVQRTRFGKLEAVQARSGRLLQLPSQPPVSQPAVIDNLAPAKGIWVTGTEAGQLAMSVSRDAGHTWTTQSLGLPVAQMSSFDEPVFASYTGMTAFLLLRLADEEFALFWTVDGGRTWHRQPGQLPWPQPVPVGAAYGLVVRPDGSLLAWLASSPTITYLESAEAGAQFRVTSSGPGGPVFAIPDGYVELGIRPALSRDAATWAPAQVSYTGPGG